MFLSSFKPRHMAAVEGQDRSPYGSFWFEPIGMRTSTGMRVTSTSAMRLGAVYSCVRVLAESFAILPFRMYRKRTDGGRDPVTDHWLVKLMTKRPNDWQTPFEWKEMMMGHLCLRGNAFNQIISNAKGQITDLVPIHPDRIKVQLTDNGSFNYVVSQLDGTTITLAKGEVWHIRGLSGDGVVGYNPMELAAEVIGMGMSAQSFGARFFANDASPGGWIEFDGKFRDSDAKTSFREGWQSNQGGKNRGRTAILEKGMKYHQLELNNADAQFLESRKYNRSEIAGLFRVPPHKIGDLDRATFSNIEQQSLDFINDGLLPWTERWEASIETHLLEDEIDVEIDFDFTKLLRGDMVARSAYYTANINNGSLTRNEARISEGRNPLTGLDKPLMPLNMVAVGEEPDGDEQPELPDAPEDAPEGPELPAKKPAGNDGRALALATAAAERVARKETSTLAPFMTVLPMPVDQIHAAMAKHADFVALALSVDAESAKAYVESRLQDPIRKGHEEQDIYNAAFAKLTVLALKGSL
jgi:HK97 family phage portal protein